MSQPINLETIVSAYWRSCVFAVAAVVSVTASSAATAEPVATEQSMADFMKGNPDCVEFNDQCSICTVVDAKANCSTPKIACIKKPYVCTRRSDK